MKKQPNLLFLFSDQHRGDWLPYDETTFREMRVEPVPVRMNNVRQLMDSGVVFSNAASNSPLCVPARACLASGMMYDRCEVYNNDYCYPLEKPTFYSVLKNGGYDVRGVGKFDLHKPILYWGKDGWLEQLSHMGFSKAIDSEGKYDLLWSSFYEPRGPYGNFLTKEGLLKIHAKDYIRRYLNANDVAATPLPDYAYADNWVAQNAINQLNEITSQDNPWFLMVNFSGPHNPWDVTMDMKKKWKDTQFPIPKSYHGDRAALNEVRQNYAAMIDNIDINIGRILEILKASGQYEDTIIIYSADHGEMMGDKDRYMKSVPYRGSVHIPLVISGPGVRQGLVCSEMVELHDLASTIVDFAGLSMGEETDSISLKDLACNIGAKPIREFQISMLYNSLEHKLPYSEYCELEQYRKQKSDKDYIEEFNEELKLDTSKTSMTKYYYSSDWRCIITKKYKLIEFEDGEPELYDLEADPEEIHNIAVQNQQLMKDLKTLYKFKKMEGINKPDISI